jgi:hypothetical protein
MAHDVFISYSHNDKPIADAICTNLEVAGIRCWIAPRDIAPGLDWPTAISNAISASRLMVLVFTAHSNSSNEVSRELILAANNNIIIIPFKIDNIAPEPGKQYYLARTHWLDAMNPPTKDQIDKLVQYAKSFILDPTISGTIKPTTEARPFAGKSGWDPTQFADGDAACKNIESKKRSIRKWGWILSIFGGLSAISGILLGLILYISNSLPGTTPTQYPPTIYTYLCCPLPIALVGLGIMVLGFLRIRPDKENAQTNDDPASI